MQSDVVSLLRSLSAIPVPDAARERGWDIVKNQIGETRETVSRSSGYGIGGSESSVTFPRGGSKDAGPVL